MKKLILQLQDAHGIELNLGDIVKINTHVKDYLNTPFFAEITYDEERKCIYPFHTFSFHSMEKVNKLPDTAVKLDEKRYNCWFDKNRDKNTEAVKEADKYLMSWRQCEHNLNKRMYHIKIEE